MTFCFKMSVLDTRPTNCGLRGCDTVRWVPKIFSEQAHCLVGVHIPPNTLIIAYQTTRCQMPGHHNARYMYRNARLAVTRNNPSDRAAGFDCRQRQLVISSYYGDQLQNFNSAILTTVLTKIALQKFKD